eukprot:8872651-Pyramimonas_sp.AAC.1
MAFNLSVMRALTSVKAFFTFLAARASSTSDWRSSIIITCLAFKMACSEMLSSWMSLERPPCLVVDAALGAAPGAFGVFGVFACLPEGSASIELEKAQAKSCASPSESQSSTMSAAMVSGFC